MATKTTTTPKKKLADAKSNTTWDLTEENMITRTEGDSATEEIAQYDEEKKSLTFTSDDMRSRYGAAAYQFLADEKIEFNPDLSTVAGTEGADLVAEENTPEFNASIPKEPRQSIYQGDKTPRYVEWLKKYKPNTFNQKFGVIGQGQVTKYRDTKDEQTGRPIRVPYIVDALISRRKTHLTEKPESVAAIDDGAEDES